jgi:hypothetical protein
MYKIIKVIIVLGKDQQATLLILFITITDSSYYYMFNSFIGAAIGFVFFFYTLDAVLIVLSSDNLKADRTVIKLIENNTSPSPR